MLWIVKVSLFSAFLSRSLSLHLSYVSLPPILSHSPPHLSLSLPLSPITVLLWGQCANRQTASNPSITDCLPVVLLASCSGYTCKKSPQQFLLRSKKRQDETLLRVPLLMLFPSTYTVLRFKTKPVLGHLTFGHSFALNDRLQHVNGSRWATGLVLSLSILLQKEQLLFKCISLCIFYYFDVQKTALNKEAV